MGGRLQGWPEGKGLPALSAPAVAPTCRDPLPLHPSCPPRRQLGFGPATGPVAGSSARFARAPPHAPSDAGWGTTWREHPWRCAGGEASVDDCPYDKAVFNAECGHGDDVWLECQPAPGAAADARDAGARGAGGSPGAAEPGPRLKSGRGGEAAEAGDLSLFLEAMAAAGLMGELEDPSKAATVFAPTTRALERLRAELGPANAAALLGDPRVSRRLLAHHVVRGRATDFDRLGLLASEAGGRLALPSADGGSLEVTVVPRKGHAAAAASTGGRRLLQAGYGEVQEFDLLVDGGFWGGLGRGACLRAGQGGSFGGRALLCGPTARKHPCAFQPGNPPFALPTPA
jgi:hypothetical protein